MKKICLTGVLLGFGALILAEDVISGTIIKGYRVLDLKAKTGEQNFLVYRGDYIKFDHGFDSATLVIPEQKVDEVIPGNVDEMPHFKMSKVGELRYSLGSVSGRIRVIEFEGSGYHEFDADQFESHLKTVAPFLLDVRTQAEFDRAHLKGAVLIPVQEIQERVKELEKYKNQDILVYCASGNRSTVASKVLIDNGFQSVYNMRFGIKDWIEKQKPVVKP